MARSKVTIKLNSAEIDRFLKTSPEIEQILEENGKRVLDNLPESIDESKELYKSSNQGKYLERRYGAVPFNQEVFSEFGEVRDRMRYLVGINNAHPADFLFGTISRATEKAGAKPGKRKSRKRKSKNFTPNKKVN